MSSQYYGPKEGWVYILKNPSMPGLLKIGMTTRHPDDRARELSGETGVPLPFEVCFFIKVSDCRAVEKKLHELLADFRVHNRREFFRMTLGQARKRVKAAACAHRVKDFIQTPIFRIVSLLCLFSLVFFLYFYVDWPETIASFEDLLLHGGLHLTFDFSKLFANPNIYEYWQIYLGIFLGLLFVVLIMSRPNKFQKRMKKYKNKRR